MNCCLIDGVSCACAQTLPFPPSGRGPEVWLFRRPAQQSRASFVPTAPGQLTAAQEDVSFLDARRTPDGGSADPALAEAVRARRLRAVNLDAPGWRALLRAPAAPGKKRLHIAAMGDVGGTIALGLRLLGGGTLSAIGICDVNEKAAARWELELGQVSDPWGGALPPVEIVSMQDVFACDIFVFAAARGVPPLAEKTGDVRMAQLEANRGLVRLYAKKAREAGFRGLFAVVSDPVDPLARAAFDASNEDETGAFDGLGLRPEQIQGFGLGVMQARAAYYAERMPEFAQFLREGRAFGPHGEGLVIADSVEHYDDRRSRALTKLALGANLQMRALGYKPYVAPALSSAALQLLRAARGEWHLSSVFLGGAYFGVRNRFAELGVETEELALPDALYARLEQSWRALRAIR